MAIHASIVHCALAMLMYLLHACFYCSWHHTTVRTLEIILPWAKFRFVSFQCCSQPSLLLLPSLLCGCHWLVSLLNGISMNNIMFWKKCMWKLPTLKKLPHYGQNVCFPFLPHWKARSFVVTFLQLLDANCTSDVCFHSRLSHQFHFITFIPVFLSFFTLNPSGQR